MRTHQAKLRSLIVKKNCASILYQIYYQMTFRIYNLIMPHHVILGCKRAWSIDLFSAFVGLEMCCVDYDFILTGNASSSLSHYMFKIELLDNYHVLQMTVKIDLWIQFQLHDFRMHWKNCQYFTPGLTYLMLIDVKLFEPHDSVAIKNENNLSIILNQWWIMNRNIRRQIYSL
jgi:hypothetical protein